MVHPNLVRVFATVALGVACMANPSNAFAQEDSVGTGRSEAGAPGFFGRMFPPSAPRSRSQRSASKDSSSNGGFFVPLKSFSNVFKGKSQDDGLAENEPAERSRIFRAPKEPFTTPSRADRRNSGSAPRDDIEMHVTELDEPDALPEGATEMPDDASTGVPEGRAPASASTSRSFSGNSVPVAMPKPPKSNAVGSGVGSGVAPQSSTEDAPDKVPSGSFQSNKVFEATPQSKSIDTKGTSRRSSSTTDSVLKSARSPKAIAAERKSESKTNASFLDDATDLLPGDGEEMHAANTSETKPVGDGRNHVDPKPDSSTPTAQRDNTKSDAGVPRSDAIVPPTPRPLAAPMLHPSTSAAAVPNKTVTSLLPPTATKGVPPIANAPTAMPVANNPSPVRFPAAKPTPATPTSANLASRPDHGQASTTGESKSKVEPKPMKVIADKSVADKPSPRGSAPRTPEGSKPRAGIDARSPQVRLRVEGSDAILVGQSTPYEVIATNEGKDILQGLLVRASVPKGIRITDASVNAGRFELDEETDDNGIVWEIDQLPPNSSKSLKLMLNANQAEHFALGLEWTVAPPVSQMAIMVQQPKLELALEGASEAEYGRPQKYRMRIRNPGNAAAKGVTLALTGSAQPQETVVGDIPAESERIVEAELVFKKSGIAPIQAIAISQESQLESKAQIDVQIRQSNLIAHWSGPAEFYLGSTATYTLTLENTGMISALDQDCVLELPEGVDAIELPDDFKRAGTQVKWSIPKLDVGSRVEYALQLGMNRPGANQIQLIATGKTGEPFSSRVTTQVEAVADLHLTVTDPVAPAPVGQPVVYEISITNRGKKSAEEVYVIAQFSEGIEPTRLDGHTGKWIPGQAIFDTVPSIGPGETLVLKVIAEASKPGTHRFRAAVKCQGSEDDLLEEGSTRYTASSTLGTQRK